MSTTPLKAPFPAFGGKSQVAALVWERLGDPRNYIEPFAFSSAMLLRRPTVGVIETINDLNAYVSNFWRAIQADPEAVARYADWPVNETDLHARHKWLVRSEAANTELAMVRDDPDHFNPKIAGWWCWGACCWIGSGWCEHPEWEGRGSGLQTPRHVHAMAGSEVVAEGDDEQLPHMSAQGVHRKLTEQLPHMDASRGCIGSSPRNELDQTRPHFSEGSAFGQGVHAKPSATIDQKRPRTNGSTGGYMPGVLNNVADTHRPAITDEFTRGRGVNSNDSLGTCETRRRWLVEWFGRLADRLRPVRVCCGHWARVCDSDSTLIRLGTTGVFLDPPYRKHLADGTKNRSAHIYANDKHQDVAALCDEVQAWCLKWGDNREIRIALCGLEGEYPAIDAAGWEKVAWKSRGGYGNRTEQGKATTYLTHHTEQKIK